MNYFQPGFREIVRFVLRTKNRISLRRAERDLAKAETNLGLLGWQQADFDAQTQRQVDALQNVEREQSNLTNRGAEIARQIAQLEEDRTKAEKDFAENREAIEELSAKVREPLEALKHQIDERRQSVPNVERRTAELDRELREVEELHSRLLLTDPQTDEIRRDLLQIRERIIAIPNEKKDLRAAAARIQTDVDGKMAKRVELEKHLAELGEQLSHAEAEHAKREEEFAERANALEAEKTEVESTVDLLERGKNDPYREIGRVLADSGMAPLNQPQALTEVTELRERTENLRSAIDASLADSAQEDRQQMRISLALCAVVAISVLLVLGAML
jgi:chromosome segregation ATPase